MCDTCSSRMRVSSEAGKEGEGRQTEGGELEEGEGREAGAQGTEGEGEGDREGARAGQGKGGAAAGEGRRSQEGAPASQGQGAEGEEGWPEGGPGWEGSKGQAKAPDVQPLCIPVSVAITFSGTVCPTRRSVSNSS